MDIYTTITLFMDVYILIEILTRYPSPTFLKLHVLSSFGFNGVFVRIVSIKTITETITPVSSFTPSTIPFECCRISYEFSNIRLTTTFIPVISVTVTPVSTFIPYIITFGLLFSRKNVSLSFKST